MPLSRTSSMGKKRSIKNFEVRHTGNSEAVPFVKQHHYSGRCHGGAMCWSLIDTEHDELIGVAAFVTPISENVRRSLWKDDKKEELKHHVTELHRFVTLDDTPHNTETWFLSRALKGLKDYKPKYKAIISFADETFGHVGTIYQALSAIYYGKSGSAKYYKDEDGNMRSPREGGYNVSNAEAKERGWTVHKRESKHRYVFILPDPYESKEDVFEDMCIESLEYPKA